MSFNSKTHRSLRKLKFMGVSPSSALCSCSRLHPQTNLTSLPISLNNSYLIYPVYLLGEGNGNPFQSSCLENPVDRGACGLLSMGSHRVGHDWSDLAAAAAVAVCNNILSELSFNSWEFLLSASMYLLYVLSVTIRFPFAMAFNDAPFYANCQNIVTEPVLKTQR